MWGTIAKVAAPIVGGLLGSKAAGTGSTNPNDAYPDWAKPLAWDAYGDASQLQTPEYYQGNQVAGMNDWQNQALSNMAGYRDGPGGHLATMQGLGAGLGMEAMQGGLGYMNDLRNQGPNTFQYDQGLYDHTMGNMMGGYQGMFDSGAQDIQRNFDWNMLPGLNMGNALGNGQGATKLGQDTALGQAMTGKNIQDFGLGLWNQANQMANQNAFGAGTQNLASANRLQGDLLNNYGQYANLGNRMANDSFDMGAEGIRMGAQAGGFQQAYDQSLIDADMAKWNFNQSAPWIAANQKITWANQGRGAQPTPGASPWEGALQGAQAGLGLYNAGRDAGWWGGGSPAGSNPGDWGSPQPSPWGSPDPYGNYA